MAETSTKPYLIRAIHEWCTDNGFRPYIAVAVDEHTIVPREFVRNGEIVLNVSPDAANRLRLGNELIEFEARFNRVSRQISIPVENITAVYAAETGQGMAFEVTLGEDGNVAPDDAGHSAEQASSDAAADEAGPARGPVLVDTPVPQPQAAGDEPSEPPPAEPPEGKSKDRRPKLTRIK